MASHFLERVGKLFLGGLEDAMDLTHVGFDLVNSGEPGSYQFDFVVCDKY